MPAAKPDLSWLADARAALNADPAFRKLGNADFSLGLVIGEDARIVSFEAFEIAAIEQADPADMRDADLIIRMAPKDWDAYLCQRRRGSGATLLSYDLEHHVVEARDPLERLLLERYNGSVQALLDKGASLTGGSGP